MHSCVAFWPLAKGHRFLISKVVPLQDRTSIHQVDGIKPEMLHRNDCSENSGVPRAFLSPTWRIKLRKKMKKNWGKWEEIQENEKKLMKCSYLAQLGMGVWLCPWYWKFGQDTTYAWQGEGTELLKRGPLYACYSSTETVRKCTI